MPFRPILRSTLSLLLLLALVPAHADVLDTILERGTIRVGVAEFVPVFTLDIIGYRSVQGCGEVLEYVP